MEKILEHLTAREQVVVKEAVETIYKELKHKFRDSVKTISEEQEWEQGATTASYGLFPEINIDEYVEKLEVKGGNIEELKGVITSTINEEKKESIPEALKHFINEDGDVDEETVSEIKVALNDRATVKEFETFKTTPFAKSLKDGYEVSIDNFKVLKERVNDTMLAKLMNGEIKEDGFLGAAFVSKVVETKAEEEEVVETPEQKIERLKEESKLRGRTLTPEEEAEVNTHEKNKALQVQLDFLLSQKESQLKGANGESRLTEEEVSAKLAEYKEKMIEKLSDKI